MGHKHKIDNRYQTYKMSSPRLTAQRLEIEEHLVPTQRVDISPKICSWKWQQLRDDKSKKLARGNEVSTWRKVNMKPRKSNSLCAKNSRNSYKQAKAIRGYSRSASGPRRRPSRTQTLQLCEVSQSLGRNNVKKSEDSEPASSLSGSRKNSDRSPSPLRNLLFSHHQAKTHFNVTPLRLSYVSAITSNSGPFAKPFDEIPMGDSDLTVGICPKCMTPAIPAKCDPSESARSHRATEIPLQQGDSSTNKAITFSHGVGSTDMIRPSESVSCQAPSEREELEAKATQVNSLSSQDQSLISNQPVRWHEPSSRQRLLATEQNLFGLAKPSYQKNGRSSGGQTVQEMGGHPHRGVKETHRRIPAGQKHQQQCVLAAEGQLRKDVIHHSLNHRGFAKEADGNQYALSPSKLQTHKRDAEEFKQARQRLPGQVLIRRSGSSCDNSSVQKVPEARQNSCRSFTIIEHPHVPHAPRNNPQSPLPIWKSIAKMIIRVFGPFLRFYGNDFQSPEYAFDQLCDFPGSSVDAAVEMHYAEPNERRLACTILPVHSLKGDLRELSHSPCSKQHLLSLSQVANGDYNQKSGRNIKQRDISSANFHKGKYEKIANHETDNAVNKSYMHTFTLLGGCVGDLALDAPQLRRVYSKENLDRKPKIKYRNRDVSPPAVCESLSEEIFSSSCGVRPFFYSIGSKIVMREQYQEQNVDNMPGTQNGKENYPLRSVKHNAERTSFQQATSTSPLIAQGKVAQSESYTGCLAMTKPSKMPAGNFTQSRIMRRKFEKEKYCSSRVVETPKVTSSPPRSNRICSRPKSPVTQGRAAHYPAAQKKPGVSRRVHRRLLTAPFKNYMPVASSTNGGAQSRNSFSDHKTVNIPVIKSKETHHRPADPASRANSSEVKSVRLKLTGAPQ